MKHIFRFAILMITSVTSSLFAFDESDTMSINQIIDHFSSTWNHHRGQGCGHFYAPDADFVNIYGGVFEGREEIEQRHISIHETILRGSTFEILNSRLREAKPGVVIAHVYWKVTNIRKPMQDTMTGIFTHIFS